MLPDDLDTDALFRAVGQGDVQALRALYDLTAPAVFGVLRHALTEQPSAERATERVYLHLWRAAPRCAPGPRSASLVLLRAVHAELVRHHRATTAGTPPPGCA